MRFSTRTLLALSLLTLVSGSHAWAGYAPGCTVALDVPGSVLHEFHDVAIQPDGKIVAVGYVEWPGGERDFLIARFHEDLAIDRSFAAPNGYTTLDFSGLEDEAYAVLIQFDLKIVVGGYRVFNPSKRDMAYTRLNRDGTIDTGFGLRAVDFLTSATDEIRGLAIYPDGRIVAAGFYMAGGVRRTGVFRILKNGAVDTAFTGGTPVFPTVSDYATDVALDRQGRILLGLTMDSGLSTDIGVARLDSVGNLDTSFAAPNGWNAVDVGAGTNDVSGGMVLQPNEAIVVSGSSNGDMAAVRFSPTGAPDGGFGPAVTNDFALAPDRGHDVALDGAGNLVIAGQARITSVDFAVARFFPSGGFDKEFSSDITPVDDIAYAVQVLDSGQILLAGSSGGPGAAVATLALFNPDGSQSCSERFLHPTADATGGFIAVGCGAGPPWTCVNDQAGDVDEGPVAAPDDLSFVQGALSGVQSLYELADGKLPVGKVVTELEVVARMAKIGTVSPEVQVMFSVPGFAGDVMSGNLLTISNLTYQNFSHRFTGLNLTPAELDAARIGVDFSGGDGLAISQVYVRATFGDSLIHPVKVFTATASGDGTGGRISLQWLNPPSGLYDRTIIRRRELTCPTSSNDGSLVATTADGLGETGNVVDTAGLVNGTQYFYAAFVEDAEGHDSPGVCMDATPFDRTASKKEWIYRTESSLPIFATPGLRIDFGGGESVAYSVATDGVVHAIAGGGVSVGGGGWPAGFRPPTLQREAPSRPIVVPLPPSNQLAVVVGAADGRAYAVDALSGELLWQSPRLGSTIVGSPAAVLTAFSGSKDLIFVGTRMMGAVNRLYALNASDGTVAWHFDNGAGPNAFDMVVSTGVVDYATERLYFTSYAGPSGMAVWCLDYTAATPPGTCPGWAGSYGASAPSGADVGSSPILYKGLLYMSDASPGAMFAMNPASPTPALPGQVVGGSGVNGYVFPKYWDDTLLLATDSGLHSVDSGTLSINWSVGATSPSTPLHVIGTDQLYVGVKGGVELHSASAPVAPVTECLGDCANTLVGSPVFDVLRLMLYVGTNEGEVYGLRTPF